MKYIASILLPILFTITACGPVTEQPVSSNEQPTSQTGDFIPSPADSNPLRGNVFLDSTELLTMESYPLQFMLVLKGSLPTPCHKLRVAVNPPDTQNKIVVDVYSVADPIAICVQMLEPFEESFPLGSFPAGHYTLWVNGEQISEFDS